MEVVELKVRLHCKECEKFVRRALSKLKGVTCVDVDVISNKITVLGYVNRNAVIKAVRRTGTRAEVVPSCRDDSGGYVGAFPRWRSRFFYPRGSQGLFNLTSHMADSSTRRSKLFKVSFKFECVMPCGRFANKI